MSARLFIGKVAQAVGLSVQAVRYYERLGLLPPAGRTAGGYRAYRPEAVERLRFIRQAQAAGFRLKEIREILRMKFAGQSPCECVRTMLQRKLEEVEEQMAALRRFRKQLRRTLQQARSLPRLPHRASVICPMIESMPTVGNKGGKKR